MAHRLARRAQERKEDVLVKRLSELEADARKENKEAQRWLKKNESLLEPDLTDSHRVREQTMHGDVRVERLMRLGMWAQGEDDLVDYNEGSRFVPLIGQPQEFDLKRAELDARVRHVLSFVKEEQRELLLAYYVEGLNWSDLRREKESRQAVHERLSWARNSFLKAWIAHAEDELDIKEVDL